MMVNNKYYRIYKKKQGFTILLIYLALIFVTYFLFMRQNENLLEITALHKKITKECRINDLIQLKASREEIVNSGPNDSPESNK